MEKLVAHIRATLSEEERLVGELAGLAHETRDAILKNAVDKLTHLNARKDNALVRLEITRQSQTRLLQSVFGEDRPVSVKRLLEVAGAEDDLKRLSSLENSLRHLQELHRENSRLLQKQLASVRAYGQVLDLVRGANKIYDRGGAVHRLDEPARIEQRS
jgi:polyphosphate kinase